MADHDALAEEVLIEQALPLVRMIREEPTSTVEAFLAGIAADRLRVMAVVLAALVPADATVSDLTAWTRTQSPLFPETAIELDNGEIVDLVAVDRVLEGHRMKLTRTEKRAAVLIGTRAGLSAAQLAELLDTTTRSVQRHRKALAS